MYQSTHIATGWAKSTNSGSGEVVGCTKIPDISTGCSRSINSCSAAVVGCVHLPTSGQVALGQRIVARDRW
jgi:hypothetical protein